MQNKNEYLDIDGRDIVLIIFMVFGVIAFGSILGFVGVIIMIVGFIAIDYYSELNRLVKLFIIELGISLGYFIQTVLTFGVANFMDLDIDAKMMFFYVLIIGVPVSFITYIFYRKVEVKKEVLRTQFILFLLVMSLYTLYLHALIGLAGHSV